MPLVTIDVEEAATLQSPPGNHITFQVVNHSDQPVWLVDDDWFGWDSSAEITEISFARGKMVPGVAVFGYFKPKLQKIEPTNAILKQQDFEWPVRLSGIWNREQWASPPSGTIQIRIKMGFGLSPRIPPQDSNNLTDVEESVLSWQQEVFSKPFEMEIPDYPKPPESEDK